MNEYIQSLLSIIRNTLTLLLFEVRGHEGYSDEDFKKQLYALIDEVVGNGTDGEPEERQSE